MSVTPPAAEGPTRRRTGLAGQATVVTTAVALLAVLITGLVSLGLVRSAVRSQQARTLSREAALVAAVAGRPAQELRRQALLTQLQVVALQVHADGRVTGLGGRPAPRAAAALPASLVSAAAGGAALDTTTGFRGRSVFLAARPAADGDGDVVLAQPTSSAAELSHPLRNRLLLALLVGLAIAVGAGVLLARRLARPLQQAAGAAHRLAGGQRDVRLQPSGPAEVAEVAEALNTLTGALAQSEDRQRQFLLSVSHELRTPLTAVKGYAEALADGVVAPAEVAGTGATMLAEADRLERLVNDLLDLARLGAQDFRVELAPVDLGGLLAAAGQVWADRCAREGVRLRVEAPVDPLVVTSDATRLRQILDGLAENALRVTPAGAPVVLAARREGPVAVLEVRDGGPGLTDDDLAVAFDRFALYDRYRGQRRVGTGVGLALVAGLAVRLGGRAEAGHAAEGGARFAVRLPVAPADYPGPP